MKPAPILAALFFLVIGNINGGNNINLVCPEIEREALLSIKASLKDPSNILSTWNISADVNCCNWNGVVCSNITGGGRHVQQLRLQGGLRGKMNPSLVNLQHLSYLDLSQNEFEETIPSFIGSIASLEYLNLSRAGFYGTVPRSIGDLSNLRVLILEGNYDESQLSVQLNVNNVAREMDVDSLEWLSRLSRLELLHVNYVNLSRAASWQQVINTLPSLVELKFRYCNLNFDNAPFNNGVISNVTSLAILDLSRNNFRPNYTIPGWIFQLSNLTFLDLSYNSFQGPIPRGIANLCKILRLDLSYNNLEGDISDSFGNASDCFLGSLEWLDLSRNQISGNLSDRFFGDFKSLIVLKLGSNSLSGAIPVNIVKMSSLEYLDLSVNKFTGNLPESVGQLFNFRYLNIRDNKMEGVLTKIHFANLTNLYYLSASWNNFTFNVGRNWIPPFKLRILMLSSCDLGEGTEIPSWIEMQKTQIHTLDLSSTGISGNVPSWIWKVRFLNLSHNQLHGSIPVISDIGRRHYLYLSSNQFSGSLPRVAPNVSALDLSNNSFSGGLSHFLCEMNETYSLGFLHLGGNQLSGEIPDCWMKWPSMEYLNLGNNILSGTIPNSIGFLTGLRSLNLYGNKISGPIPFSMSSCTKLVKIGLSDNEIDGSIPSWMGTSLANLKILILRSNKLNGKISSGICHLNYLQILDLSDNKFSGIIPRCVDNFTAMATERSLPEYGIGELDYNTYRGFFRDSAKVATKGSELQYDTILALVTNIDLSNNNLSGDIPKELTSLVELRSLNLSGNQLTGSIPDSIGDMKQLESLDLSRNSLSGEMPNSFRVMSTLNYLNVSYNKLTGRIPESTQFWGFNASSFIGNELCGPPLTNSCSNSGGPKNREDKSSSKIEWYFVFLSLGYGFGFSVVCTTLALNKLWREAYFGFLENIWNRIYLYCYTKWARLTKPAS
ncbi:hypothetical protein ABFS82_14G218600 [Erythranthe guttata]|uniref:leucine-rich repeat receptor-like protein kinase PEPR1 n=1 Tax=Erythranthe guttata TaxID=4155 RepID=UPI00064D957C|nr:PREDICTED: leucine-rich repeat receptor-like protein kinase PEPR1 [Erythranthe guttata]|eukprot:XP_012844646.1 PREDICTED: leucine-rich repeat receptor-like protein kinase PEPR1 [Erythranthe guttata]